jgi:NAD dependent epimerase/dehydratase family enzyme
MMHIILGEMHQILFESQHVLPHGLLHSGFEFQFESLPQVFQDLDKH